MSRGFYFRDLARRRGVKRIQEFTTGKGLLAEIDSHNRSAGMRCRARLSATKSGISGMDSSPISNAPPGDVFNDCFGAPKPVFTGLSRLRSSWLLGLDSSKTAGCHCERILLLYGMEPLAGQNRAPQELSNFGQQR